MILNSIDAFKEYGRKGNRQITVNLEKPSEAATNIKMRYVDNASGIDISKLKYLGGTESPVLDVDDVFKAGVTSKKEGSGYGLFLVRNILREHNGSINLISHRQGIVFDIDLPYK